MAPLAETKRRRAADIEKTVDRIAGPIRRPPNAPLTFPLPKKGAVDPYFGFTRGYWYGLILPNERNNYRPPVRSITDRSRSSARRDGGAPRAKRVIVFDSALEYVNRLAAEPEAA